MYMYVTKHTCTVHVHMYEFMLDTHFPNSPVQHVQCAATTAYTHIDHLAIAGLPAKPIKPIKPIFQNGNIYFP